MVETGAGMDELMVGATTSGFMTTCPYGFGLDMIIKLMYL
jgi:hypothetical protein